MGSMGLQDGNTSVFEDKQRILDDLDHVAKMNSSLPVIEYSNTELRAILAKVVIAQAVYQGIVEDLDPDPNVTISLPDALRASHQPSLSLSFAHSEQANDKVMELIGRSLSPKLRFLHLSFEGCRRISDEGVEKLAQAFPRHLQTLWLDFVGCKLITDSGLMALATALPGLLCGLRLDFANCTHIGLRGLRALNEHIPEELEDFRGSFVGTGANRDINSRSELAMVAAKARRRSRSSLSAKALTAATNR